MTAGTAVTAERLASQLLSGPLEGSVTGVVQRLLAVQGQDPRGARLAIRARATGLVAADVDRALTEDRSLLIIWLNRGTLHLVLREDYWWLHALTTPQLATGNARRLAQEGVDPGAAIRGVAAVEAALTRDGPQTQAQLREVVAAVDVPVAGQALVHILILAALRGLVVRGPMLDGAHAYVLTQDWLGRPPRPLDRDIALARLARRYLAGHAPADDRDLARWAGIQLGEARRGLRAIASELSTRPDGLVELVGQAPAPPLPAPLLLGAFDPLLLGWVSRASILGEHLSIVTVNGLFRPFALVGGRAVATWRMPAGRVVLEPFEPLSASVAAALASEAVDVERFLRRPSG